MSVADAARACLEYRLVENPAFDAASGAAVAADAPLAEVVNMFWGGWHRVLVDTGEARVVVSQSDVARFVANNVPLLFADATTARKPLGAFLDAPGRDTNNNLVVVRSSDTAIKALSLMVRRSVSAVPVVDAETGRLVATFSTSDLRHLTPATTPDLAHGVLEFLAAHSRKTRPFVRPAETLATMRLGVPHTCSLGDRLDHVLYKLLALQVHRLFIVEGDDAGGIPVGVVALGDLMKIFLFGDDATTTTSAQG